MSDSILKAIQIQSWVVIPVVRKIGKEWGDEIFEDAAMRRPWV